MFTRSLFVGLMLGLAVTVGYVPDAAGSWLSSGPAYLFGSIFGDLQGHVLRNSLVVASVTIASSALCVTAFTIASVLAWPAIERATVLVAALVARFRGSRVA